MLVRGSATEDVAAILALYRAVAAEPGGLARVAEEVTESYVAGFLRNAWSRGNSLVACDLSGDIVGEIHAYRPEPRAFSHVLSELTIGVHPEHQGLGVGRHLFQGLLDRVTADLPEILRVELVARESNRRAIQFYESLGFVAEGRMVGRIQSVGGGFEADIPMGWHRPQ